jgi:O-antigen/teichoic acid export membrane protein
MYPFISRISNIIINNSQCFIIAIFISPKISAIYDLTSKITIALSNFVAMANGSFFALLSLTFAKKDRREINNLVKNYSLLFFTLLFTALIYSYIFSESIIHHWVGIEKYGGNVLLSLILISTLTTQVKYFLNNLLYTGGLINKSSLFDILSMILYLITLFITINSFKINAIPFSSILITYNFTTK